MEHAIIEYETIQCKNRTQKQNTKEWNTKHTIKKYYTPNKQNGKQENVNNGKVSKIQRNGMQKERIKNQNVSLTEFIRQQQTLKAI